MHDLLIYAMGVDLFGRINSLEEAKNKLIALVRTLKASSLLLDGEAGRGYFGRGASRLLFMDDHGDNKSVRMHDVVRDVARNIASRHPHRFVVREYVPLEDCSDTDGRSLSLVRAKLQIFVLQNDNPSLNILNTFPERMNRLKVLAWSNRDFKTLSSTLQSLANHRTLCLDRCRLGDIAVIGQLKKLQVISMADSNIQQLPPEMAQLTDLKLLNLNDCRMLKVIPRDILSSLSRLECLFMKSSFSKWAIEEASEGESNIACLSELNHLNHLTTMEVEIPNVKMVPKEDKFFRNLTSFAIFIGYVGHMTKTYERSKTLKLKCGDGGLLLMNGMRKLLEKVEELRLGKLKEMYISINKMECSNVFSPSMPMNFHNLKCLSIERWGKGDKDGVLFGEKVTFPNLEELKLKGLSTLKMIWHPQLSLRSLDKLQILRVYACPCLVNLIPSHWMQGLQNLKEVIVDDCEILERVFGHGILPDIEILKLRKLPKLRHLFDTQDNNDEMTYFLSHSKFKDFHHLKELHIVNCGMPLDEKVSFSSILEVLVLKRFFKLKEIDFKNPQKLRILSLKKLPKFSSTVSYEDGNTSKRCRWSLSMSENFHSLKHLRIIDCGMEDRRDFHAPTNAIMLSNEKVSFLDGGVCNYEAFESRASTSHKIMEALRDDNIKSIGVVGIGGVGKTTLVKQVARQAQEQHLFTEQLLLDLSWTRYSDEFQQSKEKFKIQQKIAKKLGWAYEQRYWYESKDVVQMKRRLKKEKVLIILDNIWKEIHDLEELGIPSCKDDDNECKMVLISCGCGDGEELCKEMGAQICFPVEILPPEEAWTLFKKIAGANSLVEENNPEVRSIVQQVVEECEGLPIALVTNAKALKDKTQLAVWKDALEEIRTCELGKKVVYSGCRDKEGDDHFKSLLLLCGMLDYGDISIDHLLQYAIGLDLFGPIHSLDQARNRLLASVEILKDNHHPEPEDRHDLMRMHDVVYDVVGEIASNDTRAFVFIEDVGLLEEWLKSDESKSCTFISLHCKAVHELPHALVCPELQFFLLHNKHPWSHIPIPDTFFQGMKKLQVLDVSRMHFEELSSSLDSLTNLRTLRLDECSNLVNIAGIGKLTKLEVLSLVNIAIEQLPDDMSQLTNLRLLDLNGSQNLEVIPHNVLSSLSKLECLFMISRFPKWGMKGDHQSHAWLSQLKHLSCLTTLHIGIPYAKKLPKDIQFENLTTYAISIGGYWRGSRRTDRTLKLNYVNISLDLGDGIRKLMERSEELEFQELSDTNFVLQYPSIRESFAELKHLQVTDCRKIQFIIDSMDQRTFQQHGAAFPLLESLVLWKLENLQQVWHGRPIPRGSFGNLKTLEAFSCPKLRYLFPLSTATGLSQLEKMKIEWCDAMEQIISYEKESEDEKDGTNLELFPNLRTLKLERLPQLINFWSEPETNARREDSSFSQKVSFTKLEELKLYNVPKLKDVWNPQGPFGSLPNLRILWVWPHIFSNSTELRPNIRNRFRPKLVKRHRF